MEMQSQLPQIQTETDAKKQPSTAEIQDWLISYLAKMLQITPAQIDVKTSFNRYGLDSYMTVGLIADLETWLNCDLNPTLMYNYPNIESLAQHLSLAIAP